MKKPINAIEVFASIEQPNIQKKLFAQLDKKYNYADLTKAVRQMSAYLQEKNLEQDQRILIASNDHFVIAVLVWTCLRNGYTAIFLDPDIGSKRSKELIDLTAPSHLFIDQKCVDRWKADEKMAHLTVIKEKSPKKGLILKKLFKKPASITPSDQNGFWNILDTYPATIHLPSTIEDKSIAYILFTSGSTAVPKAVQISHRALWSNLETIKAVYQLDETSKIFNLLTVYHTDGLIQGPVMAAMNKAQWYHPMEFEIALIPKIFDAIYKYEITHFITVPTMLRLLYQFGEGFEDAFLTDSFKHIVTSAAPFEIKQWEAFENKFQVKIVNNYGLTETVAGASYCGPEDEPRKVGSIGKPIDCAFKIIDEDGQELCDQRSGELLIKGENILSSYLHNEKATKAAFLDGWFKTGDWAKRDEDGYYYIIGRKKNLIISGGINIQAEEVMAVLNQHPSIQDSACVGLEDDVFGEIIAAALVLKDGEELSNETLVEHCRKELEEVKIPKQFIFVESIPKTNSGKVKFADLKALFLKPNGKERATQIRNNDLKQSILEAAATAFNHPQATFDFDTATTLTVDGWDSLAHLSFVTLLEEKHNVRFSAKEIMSISSLKDVHKTLKTKSQT